VVGAIGMRPGYGRKSWKTGNGEGAGDWKTVYDRVEARLWRSRP